MPPDTAPRGKRPGARTSVCVLPAIGLFILWEKLISIQPTPALQKRALTHTDESSLGLRFRGPRSNRNTDATWEV